MNMFTEHIKEPYTVYGTKWLKSKAQLFLSSSSFMIFNPWEMDPPQPNPTVFPDSWENTHQINTNSHIFRKFSTLEYHLALGGRVVLVEAEVCDGTFPESPGPSYTKSFVCVCGFIILENNDRYVQ